MDIHRRKAVSERQQMEAACKVAIESIGGPAAVAKHFAGDPKTLTTAAVCQWKVVPPTRAKRLSEHPNCRTTPAEMRPDCF